MQKSGSRFWIQGFSKKTESQMMETNQTNNGLEPLFLSQYIDGDKLEEGRQAALVKSFLGDVKSYSGFLCINKELNINMFIWFFPSEKDPDKDPLIVWLNGWSTSSIYGIFLQNGPYIFEKDRLKSRDLSWHKSYNVLYIDNPVGIGFSFCPSETGFSKDINTVGSNLYWTLVNFFKLFPNLKENDLYIAGLSFAGKYIPAFARHIHTSNEISKNKIKLIGLFIGNPVADPSQLKYSEFLYQLGFIDQSEKKIFIEHEEKVDQLLSEGCKEEAFNIMRDLIFKTDSYLNEVTGLKTIFDFVNDKNLKEEYRAFIQRPEIRSAIHVGEKPYQDGVGAMRLLKQDFMSPIVTYLEELILHYKIMIYCGQTDISCVYTKVSEMLSSLKWPDSENYNKATRIKLNDGNITYGYLKSFGNLNEVMIRNAGHSAVTDQPLYIFNLLNLFTGQNISNEK